MKRKMKSVRVCFLILVLLEAMWCEGCWKEERQALFSLNFRSYSPFSWNVHTDCCEWEGVLCNSSTGRVDELLLELWNSDEQYINYSDFFVFKDLKVLELSYGGIVGCVGDEDLPNLEVLRMNFNYLGTGASILSCLDGLPSLKSLYLSYNKFNTSSLNDAFESASSKLRNLEVLYLSYNDLTNDILPSLEGFTSLKELYLAGTQLDSNLHIEALCSTLKNLEVLDISYNDLTNDILPSLERFTSLKELYLAGTQLDSDLHIEALCSTLKNLEVLDLSYNNFKHSDIASALSGLSSLNSLYLQYSELSWRSIFNISKLSSLEILHLEGNRLNESERSSENDGFKWPTNLEELWLYSNSLSNKFVSTLSGLPRLKLLDLSFNQLEGALDIKDNDGFKWPANLEELRLNSNRLSNKSLPSISGLPHLQFLDLSSNQLEVLPSLSGLPHLKLLDLSFNQLEGELDITENDGFKWPTNLEDLWLSSNRLSNKFVSSLSGLPHLQSLDLSSNQLEGVLDISGLFTLSSLTNLYLSYNNIYNFVTRQGSKSLSRLDVLYLDENMIDGNKLRESLRALSSSITKLYMRGNKTKGTIVAEDFHDLTNLEELRLDESSNMENEFFKSIGNLTSLKVLSVSNCDIKDTLPPTDWFKLKNLKELDLSQNLFVGSLPSSFINMTSLWKLELSQNQFSGQFYSNIASLTSLKYFGFTENQFEVPISFSPFANHSNLKFIYGEGNKVILDSQPSLQTWIPKFQLQELSMSSIIQTSSFPLPKFLFYQNQLTSLDFSSWKLEGGFPHWLLENNTKLTQVLLRKCSLSGTMQLPLHPLPVLRSIDVSDNTIIGEIPNNISSICPNLKYLNMSRNHMQGSIPHELGQMKLLNGLYLSNNQLSGEIPEGPIFSMPTNLNYLSLNDNNFSGRLPTNIFNTFIISLDVSNNNLVGKIPSLMKNLSQLSELRMSNNYFEGFIPLELAQLEYLSYLDLSENNLTGIIPSFLNSSVKFIHLSNNHLTGLSEKMFNGNSPLVMLDLSYNKISSNIQDMIQDLSYSKLNFLLLKGNHFTGDIPKQLCRLINLTMLDLSHNNFSGMIPHCLGKMPFDSKNLDPLLKEYSGSFFVNKYAAEAPLPPEQKKEKASFTSKKSTYTYMGSILAYMSGIDLSQNKLMGNIPYELGNLTKIRVLNLSHNDLTGKIPDLFSNLVQTESLDLSFNKLSGEIPPQLNNLTSLEVFSVAHNNLSGPTPEPKRQFATFDESSYENNPFLCGPPLPKSCYLAPTIIPNASDIHRNNDNLVDMYVFCVSFIVSYMLALLATATALYINPYWRQAWFYYLELVTLNYYYFIVDNLCRFSNTRNM